MATRWLPLALLLAGCVPAYVPPPREITCVRGDDCEVRWGRAIEWVLANSHWKIQQQTEYLIMTYNGGESATEPSFTIAKTAIGEGRYRISFSAGCNNMFTCVPPIPELRRRFEDSLLAPVPGLEEEAEGQKVPAPRYDGQRY